MHIRPLEPEDLSTVAQLHAQAFAVAWDAGFLGELFAQPRTFGFLVAEPDGSAGFSIASAAAGEAEIFSLAVRPRSRRRGLGSALLRETAAHAVLVGASELFLEVAAGNLAARTLYGRLGFREVGLRAAYYREPDGSQADALILKRALPL
jgi:[ribosomal protein S18]-alanine N-acetyltransferase